jgi:pimeloyl-ACP methyl ester carboxylesterase
MRFSLCLALIGLSLPTWSLATEPQPRCDENPAPLQLPRLKPSQPALPPVSWKYCIYPGAEANGQKSRDVIYYFHGAEQSHHSWWEDGSVIRAKWKYRNHPGPTVISVSFGDFWLLVPPTQNGKGGILDVYVKQLIPGFDKMLGFTPRRRMILGMSMGGFNSSQLVLRHPELFERAAILCPAVPTISAFSSRTEAKEYLKPAHVNPADAYYWMINAQGYVKSAKEWAGLDPQQLAAERFGARSPRLYFSCGDKDSFGFYGGAEQFYQKALAAGARAVWDPIPGGVHCDWNEQAIAEFLMKEPGQD